MLISCRIVKRMLICAKEIWNIALYLDFRSAKPALWLVDSWSSAPDQIQMYADRDTFQ